MDRDDDSVDEKDRNKSGESEKSIERVVTIASCSMRKSKPKITDKSILEIATSPRTLRFCRSASGAWDISGPAPGDLGEYLPIPEDAIVKMSIKDPDGDKDE